LSGRRLGIPPYGVYDEFEAAIAIIYAEPSARAAIGAGSVWVVNKACGPWLTFS